MPEQFDRIQERKKDIFPQRYIISFDRIML